MNAKILFELKPKLKECFTAGSDSFQEKDDAIAHANHFNFSVKIEKRTDYFSEEKDLGNVAQKVLSATTDQAVTEVKAKKEEDKNPPLKP
jgi:hypothetical protein